VTKSSKMSSRRRQFHARGILPTKRLMAVFLLMVIPVVLASFGGHGFRAFFILNSLLLLVSLVDWWILPRRRQLAGSRVVPEEIERGMLFGVEFHLKNSSTVPIRFRFVDELPITFEREVFPLHGSISAGEAKGIFYKTSANMRGDYEMKRIYFRYQSPIGLWEKQMSFETVSKVSVIPDMSTVRGTLVSMQQLLLHEGTKIRKSRVGGGEFAQIRNYVVGDDPRKINWRQTGKLAELMTNVYEPEHGKYITILMDCGRPMGVELTEVNRLERAIEAALTLAAVALRQGDYVSVLVFSNEVKAYVPAGKGMAHLQTIIRTVYAIQADPFESNYLLALDYIERVQKRRSFMVLFSDLAPFLFEETSLFSIQRVRRKHLFMLLGIADPSVARWIQAEPTDTRTIMIKSAAGREELRKRAEIKRWNKAGLEILEVPEEHLAAKAISRYIEVINRGVL
jgi:uncharacterized protein (DUF58 family)